MNPVKQLQQFGQAIWLDFLARGFIAKGDLKTLIDRDGVKGVTSNPSIFEKAIGSSDEYDGAISKLLRENDQTAINLYEAVAIEDIQNAADVLRPVYDHSGGDDGYVSLEVSPYLARDTEGTLAEALRLSRSVRRENLMVKIPGTREGLPAIEALTAQGISINITLLFSQKVYAQVLEAYIAGLEKFVTGGGDAKKVASVASFFISRIDVEADKQLEAKIADVDDKDQKERLGGLKGKIAIANAKLAYRHYEQVHSTERWTKLQAKGARVQRLLWASTGTKNPDYSDVKYVEALIGPDTVNTAPMETIEAYRNHGEPKARLEQDVAEAVSLLRRLFELGINIDVVAQQLEDEGVAKFNAPFDKLMATLKERSR